MFGHAPPDLRVFFYTDADKKDLTSLIDEAFEYFERLQNRQINPLNNSTVALGRSSFYRSSCVIKNPLNLLKTRIHLSKMSAAFHFRQFIITLFFHQ